MPDTHNPLKVFCSYAHEDERWLEKLHTHLSMLKNQGLISTWYDRQIDAGADWKADITNHLNHAPVILLLISADFLASPFCYDYEMQHALKRHQRGEARVIPILVRPVEGWQDAPFARLQVLPTDAQPISIWPNEDQAFVDVTGGIRRAIADLTLSAISTSQATLWNVPLPPNPFFLGRVELLAQLHYQLQQQHSAALSQKQAISGLGGVGKTQIAVEYAYRYRDTYRAVLWVRAENTETLNASYNELASLLDLPEQHVQEQAVLVQAVKYWLQRQKDWLLIFDNADEPDLLAPFLPPTIGGQILLTTRAHALRRFGIAQPLTVDSFSLEQGALLLLRRAGLLAPDESLEQAGVEECQRAMQITQILGGLPLALDQAGAYIEATGTSLATYEHLYQHYHAKLLNERRGNLQDHPAPVSTTWLLSFQRVEEKNPVAADLLRLCAFLSPDDIDEEILTDGADELGPILAPVAANEYLLEQAIEVLRSYSFITRDQKTKTLAVHRLVQAVLRDNLSLESQQQWMQRAISAVHVIFPEVEFTQWAKCERWLPHALLGAQWIQQGLIEFPQAGRFLNEIGGYLSERGQYAEAEPLYRRALAIRERVPGPDHPDTATSLNNLALLHRKQGRYEEVEPLYQRALDIRERALGPDHPDTANSLNNLAGLYENQGRYEEAESLSQRALAIQEYALGPEHPNIAISLNNLAGLYESQDKHEEAEPLYQRALDIRERALGPEHPNTAISLNNLALLYNNQGRYEEAEPLYQRALDIRERALGLEHADTAISLNNLARLYENQGRYEEAEPLYQRALTISERILGPERPDTVSILNNLAWLYESQGRYEEAEPLYQRALAIRERVLGSEHPNTAASLNNLGFLYESQGRYAEAEPLYQRALAIGKRILLEPERPDTARILNNLALLYRKQGRYEEAEPLYQRALAIRERILGPDHPNTAVSLNNLARLYESQGRYEEAEPLYQRALAIRERVLGPEHPNTAVSLNNLGFLYESQGRYAEAEPLYQRALNIQELVLGPEHPNTQIVQANYAALLQRLKSDE